MPKSPYEQYKARQAKRERREQECAPKPWYWFGQPEPVARFTLYLGFFTLALVLVGTLQWCSLQSGGVDTHNLALAAKLDQRAWVASGSLILTPPRKGDVAHASVSYVNTGRTPAKNVSPAAHLLFMPRLISSDAELSEFAKQSDMPSQVTLGVMYPGLPSETTLDGKIPLDDISLGQISGDWYTYLWGEVPYTDIFNQRHLMEFCGYRKGLTGGFLQCPFHNQPDTEEKPN